MTSSLHTGVQELGREYPDWKPWLSVIQEVLRETAEERWERFVPARAAAVESKIPLLAGLTVQLETGVVSRWVQRLVRAAYQSGAPKMVSLKGAKDGRFNNAALLQASLCHDSDRLRDIANKLGVDPDAFQAVAVLVTVPFLYACNRHWSRSVPQSWIEGYCPVCGAWPAFAEVRGIERSRYFRCGRCGGEWQAHCLFCPYCGMTNHEELVSLVPEKNGSTGLIDACKRCLRYVKSFTTLQGSPPVRVIIDDLASVDLDIAALNQNYRRPQGLGYPLSLTVIERLGLNDRIFRWR